MEDCAQFRWDSRRLNWYSGLVALIGAAGLLFVWQQGWDVKALGLGWMAAFIWGCVSLQRRKSDTEPIVIVSTEGIRDRRISDSVLPWNAISRVESFDAEHVPFVGLEFHDPKAALEHAKSMVQLFAPIHSLLRFPAVSISMSLLDGNGAELIAAIRRFKPEVVNDR